MKKFFHIPLLQCCKPFRLKETQTDISFLAGNLNNASESPESIHKDSTSYSLEYDTSIQNNSSSNYHIKKVEIDPNSCGRCTKCLLVNFDRMTYHNERAGDSFRTNRNRYYNKEEFFLSVELDNCASNQNPLRNILQVPTTENVRHKYYPSKKERILSLAKEQIVFIDYHSVLTFYFKSSVIMINTFPNNNSSILNFSQAIHLRKIVQNMPISVHPILTFISFRYIKVSLENSDLSQISESHISKLKVSAKNNQLHRSIVAQTKLERPLSIRSREGNSRFTRKAKLRPTRNIPKLKDTTKRNKIIDKKITKRLPIAKPDLLSNKTIKYNKVEDFKDFLEMWKMRRQKIKRNTSEKKDSNTSVITNSTYPLKSPDSQTREFMIKFINNQFKSKPAIINLNNKSQSNSFNKSSRSKLLNRQSENQMNEIKEQSVTSRNRIIEILVEIIYDKVIVLMVDKLSILSNNFDEVLFGVKPDNHPSMYGDSLQIHNQKLQKICNDRFLHTNPSISSTSNTGDFTESTAFDIISDQAYSDNSDCPLSA